MDVGSEVGRGRRQVGTDVGRERGTLKKKRVSHLGDTVLESFRDLLIKLRPNPEVYDF